MPRTRNHKTHDIVVIGASAGGVDAIRRLLGGLPRDLAAALFVVIHMDPSHESHLGELFSRPGGLPARTAQNGDVIRPGQILVAPRDRHLLVRSDRVEVVHGPRENGHRPAVNALFRTASAAYGPRVIGVVLTGNLDCGTAGLLSVKSRGGLAVVQEPTEAAAPSMPSSAIAHVPVDHVARLAEMPSLLRRLVESKAGPWPSEVRREVREMEGAKLGADAEVVCPNCHGKLTVSDVDGYKTFRCHVGHAFSLQGLAAAQADEVESALWAAVRALEEAAALSRRVANAMSGAMRERLLEKEHTQSEQADVVRALVLGGQSLSAADAEPSGARANTPAAENTAVEAPGTVVPLRPGRARSRARARSRRPRKTARLR
jgi:two-component system chemotaxis response regulator CheB